MRWDGTGTYIYLYCDAGLKLSIGAGKTDSGYVAGKMAWKKKAMADEREKRLRAKDWGWKEMNVVLSNDAAL